MFEFCEGKIRGRRERKKRRGERKREPSTVKSQKKTMEKDEKRLTKKIVPSHTERDKERSEFESAD